MWLGDGRCTAFWLDRWIGDAPLCPLWPALFSHSTKPVASVHAVLAGGVSRVLIPRLSRVTEHELVALEEKLSVVVLTDASDYRGLI